MGVSKSALFSDEINEMAALTKAIGHPARVAILEHLLRVNSCICGDLVAELPLAQPTISQHLRELKSAGLIQGNIEGNAICYCINPTAIARLEAYFHQMLNRLHEQKLNCC